MTQEQALSILKTGANVFLTGEPGSGKTYTLRAYSAYLRAHGIEPAITASTGIAATHIGGMTIHSWSGIGVRTFLTPFDLDYIASREYIAKRIRRAKVLIIDEVSMLSPGTLSMVDAVCREVLQRPEPFGRLQVIFCGDFFQLPPVAKEGEKDTAQSSFAYDAPVWEEARPITCYLTEQHRQDDSRFLKLLSAIRRNVFTGEHLPHMEERKISSRAAPDGIPRLYSHNADVDRINSQMLEKLSGEVKTFFMSAKGKKAVVASLQKNCLSPDVLRLKAGAAVMFTKNNPKEGFVNGTLGTVEKFGDYSGYPVVRTHAGKKIEVTPMDWTIEENGRVRARITQLPLRLAWAITVHKSQGMSLDAAVMDLSDVFEFGQGYVALSRVRSLSGLHLLGWNNRTFEVHPDILVRDTAFRAASEEAEEAFGNIAQEELSAMHARFIIVCGGKTKSPRARDEKRSGETASMLERIREKYPNAYRPWNKAQDDQLRELFEDGTPISELMTVFGRKKGAIMARLAKLGLIEYV